MADTSYSPKTYSKQGGDVFVVASGGELKIEPGGKLTNDGTQASAVALLTDSTGGTANDTLVAISGTYTQSEVRDNFADLAAKVNAIINALKGVGILP